MSADDNPNEGSQCCTPMDSRSKRSKSDSICNAKKLTSSSLPRTLSEDDLVPAADDVSVETSSANESNASLGNDTDSDSEDEGDECPQDDLYTDEKMQKTSTGHQASFASLRFSYLLVTLVIMLADGLQGKSKQK
jgi:hypothetical protein